jgi:predicted DNA-binding transcriptional regulator YafY
MDYFAQYNNETVSDRMVEPIGLCYYNYNWHMIGFCKLRNDYRDFRVDRILQIEKTEQTYKAERRDSLQDYLQTIVINEHIEPIILHFDNEFVKHLGSSKYYYGFLKEKDCGNGKTEMFFMNDSLEYIAKWLLMCGNKVEIIKPQELKNITTELVNELNRHYLL